MEQRSKALSAGLSNAGVKTSSGTSTRRMRAGLRAGAALALVIGALAGIRALAVPSSARPPSGSPNILLITVDTLRPDALGWIGGKNTTPVIDELAREGVRFRSAISPAPLTLPSHTSLMTGLLPRRHGVRDNGEILDPATATLATRLRATGYATAAFVSGYPLRRIFGLDRGFEVFDDRLPVGAEGWLERPASQTTAAALAWVATAHAPWFLWVHYYDPHDPYTPPRAFLRPGPRGAYDGEVAYVDAALGQLMRGLPAGSRAGRITVFAGDHGESLGEHGESGHGFFLYDTTILVPLIFHAPGQWKPRESAAPARLVDVAPTLIELLRLPPSPALDGTSLIPLLTGRTEEVGAAYLETRQPWLSYGWAPLSAVRESHWKLIQAPRPELYDLQADPLETKNLVAANREKTADLLRRLAGFESGRPAGSRRTGDAEALARLRSLGYLGSGSSTREPGRNLPDPKDRLAERSRLLRAEELLREGKFDESVGFFDDVLKNDPVNRFALTRSGIALLKKGDLAGAISRLEKSVALDADQAENQFALADALTRAGQYARAIPHWMETARLQPRRVAAWSNLGTALGRAGRLADAIKAFAHAVALEPKNPLLLENLAFAEKGLDQDDAAIKHLVMAASLTPPEHFPYGATLGLLYLKTGETGQAAQWLRRSRPREPDYAEARLQLALIDVYRGDKAEAKRELDAALAAQPALRSRAESNPALAALLKQRPGPQ